MGALDYHLNVKFTNDRSSRALLSNNTISIFVQKSNNPKTIFMILVSFFAHEYTHFIRSKLNSYNYPFYKPKNDYEYFLNPEEIIAFYNQIVVESYFRQCTFKKCLSSFIKHNISDVTVAKRFQVGLCLLYTNKKFISIKSENVKLALEIKNNLDKFSNYVDEWSTINIPNYDKDSLTHLRQMVFKNLSNAF